MDHSQVPVLEALAAYHAEGQTPFTPPGHKQGRGTDPRVLAVLGEDVFRADVLATAGLDDRVSSLGVMEKAQALKRDMADHAAELSDTTAVRVPDPAQLRLEQVLLPRDAFFGPTEQVPWDKAVGRISAEMLTPYPPGIPAVLPGERLNKAVVSYLRTGVEAGMVVPDAVDTKVNSVRVAIEE